MHIPILFAWLVAGVPAVEPVSTKPAQPTGVAAQDLGPSPSEPLASALEPVALRELAREALERNPDVARARQRSAALAARAPQVRSLPDPTASLTLFALPPETRAGPQRLTAGISQRLPWFGKLALRERAALYAAAAAEAEVETVRLDVLTEVRRLFYELAFHDHHELLLRTERGTLERYEEAARARYAAGSGTQQAALRIQAEITRLDTRSLEIREHAASLRAALNALRDRPFETEIHGVVLPEPSALELDNELLRQHAAASRPELAVADAELARRATLVELAEKERRPDVTVGLAYTLVDHRQDAPGRLVPPPDNGDDILALSASVPLPVRRKKLEAMLEEAHAWRRMAEDDKRRVEAEIMRQVGDLRARLPLLREHWQLLDGVLHVQAREGLHSAEAAYTTGHLSAVDLLDAEVVLLDVRTAAARTRTDHAVARAQLERAIAGSLTAPTSSPEDSHHD